MAPCAWRLLGLEWLVQCLATTSASSTRTTVPTQVSKHFHLDTSPCPRLYSLQCTSTCIWCVAGYYFSGDGAHRTTDGFYRITGRMDDVINVSGHRLGTAEVEDSLVCVHVQVVIKSLLCGTHTVLL